MCAFLIVDYVLIWTPNIAWSFDVDKILHIHTVHVCVNYNFYSI